MHQNARVGKLDDALERLLWAVAKRSSGRSITALALILYAGFGLAVPLIFGWPVPWLVSANIVGTAFAGTLIAIWLAIQVQARDRRHLVEWTSDMRLLDSTEFEWLVGEIYRRRGWKVEETGRTDGPDGGVDLSITRDGKRSIVQCKRWTSWPVGVEHVRTFAGALLREGLAGDSGVFVTLSSFTEQARAEGERIGLTLLDNRDMYAMVEEVRKPEPCPICGAPMVLDRSTWGWWFRCVAASCSGKRDLGRDPARAVELLTEYPG